MHVRKLINKFAIVVLLIQHVAIRSISRRGAKVASKCLHLPHASDFDVSANDRWIPTPRVTAWTIKWHHLRWHTGENRHFLIHLQL